MYSHRNMMKSCLILTCVWFLKNIYAIIWFQIKHDIQNAIKFKLIEFIQISFEKKTEKLGLQKDGNTVKIPAMQHVQWKTKTNKSSYFFRMLLGESRAEPSIFFSPCRARSRLWRSSKRLVVGQLFSGCKRTGEMQKAGCLFRWQETKTSPKTPTQHKKKEDIQKTKCPSRTFEKKTNKLVQDLRQTKFLETSDWKPCYFCPACWLNFRKKTFSKPVVGLDRIFRTYVVISWFPVTVMSLSLRRLCSVPVLMHSSSVVSRNSHNTCATDAYGAINRLNPHVLGRWPIFCWQLLGCVPGERPSVSWTKVFDPTRPWRYVRDATIEWHTRRVNLLRTALRHSTSDRQCSDHSGCWKAPSRLSNRWNINFVVGGGPNLQLRSCISSGFHQSPRLVHSRLLTGFCLSRACGWFFGLVACFW